MLELLVSDFRPYVQDAVAILVCLAAFRWGGAPERLIALIWLVLFKLVGRAYEFLFVSSFQLTGIDPFLASVDLVAGGLFLFIALNANRNYPLWIAAMQLLAIVAHLARGLTEAIAPIAYAIMVIAPGWMQLLLLAVGLVRHVRRARIYGPYREWRTPQMSEHPFLARTKGN